MRLDLKKAGHEASLTTVYRNLPLLLEAGIIRRATVFDETHGGATYECVWGHSHHDHLICARCGKLVEFSYPAIEVLQEAIARDYGFVLLSHQFELVGLCTQCQALAPSESQRVAAKVTKSNRGSRGNQ